MTADSNIIKESNLTGAWTPGRGLRLLLLVGWIGIGLISTVLALSALPDLPLLANLLDAIEAHVPGDRAMYSPLAYFCLLSLVYLLERRIPARPQALFSAGLYLDALWYFATLVFRVGFLGLYVKFLHSLYHQYLSFLTVDAISDWSALSRFLLAALVIDFCRWLSHLIRHKVPLFWQFHAVHHSQIQLNLFTDARVHPVDRMFSSTLHFIPLLMLGNDVPVILGWAIFETIYPKFYHANLQINFGPLRYILVTPQSHRVHHAMAPAYQDKNFGFILSIWDRLFGTHYQDDYCYPDTGIADPEFPHERQRNPGHLAKILLAQLLHPFQRLLSPRTGEATSSD